MTVLTTEPQTDSLTDEVGMHRVVVEDSIIGNIEGNILQMKMLLIQKEVIRLQVLRSINMSLDITTRCFVLVVIYALHIVTNGVLDICNLLVITSCIH